MIVWYKIFHKWPLNTWDLDEDRVWCFGLGCFSSLLKSDEFSGCIMLIWVSLLL